MILVEKNGHQGKKYGQEQRILFVHDEFKILRDWTTFKFKFWAQRKKKASPHGSGVQRIYIHEGAKHISQLTKNSAIS